MSYRIESLYETATTLQMAFANAFPLMRMKLFEFP